MSATEIRSQSVLALRKLLLDVIQEPEIFVDNATFESFEAALKSQGKIAKWSDNSLGIVGCSLNTIKRAADNVLDGGYPELDQLRINALAGIDDFSAADGQGNKSSKAGLRKKVDELENQVSLLEQQNSFLVFIVTELRSKAFQYAGKADEDTKAICEREMVQISKKISYTGNASLIEKVHSNGSK